MSIIEGNKFRPCAISLKGETVYARCLLKDLEGVSSTDIPSDAPIVQWRGPTEGNLIIFGCLTMSDASREDTLGRWLGKSQVTFREVKCLTSSLLPWYIEWVKREERLAKQRAESSVWWAETYPGSGRPTGRIYKDVDPRGPHARILCIGDLGQKIAEEHLDRATYKDCQGFIRWR